MTPLACTRRHALALLAACAAAPLHAAALPGDSIYRLDVPMADQDGRPFHLSDLRGEPVLASMFYSSCDMVCPMIFQTISMVLDKSAARQKLRVLMVSFDPTRDSVAVLKKTAATHHADARWTLARPDDSGARQVAAVLGVQYRRLASGEYNHSSGIALLDRDGRIHARTSVLGTADPKFVASIRQVTAAA